MRFFNWKYVLGGGSTTLFVGIYQYLVKLGVFFNIPWINELWHPFSKWIPSASTQLQDERIEVENVSIPSDCYSPSLLSRGEMHTYFTQSFDPMICKYFGEEPIKDKSICTNGEVNYLIEQQIYDSIIMKIDEDELIMENKVNILKVLGAGNRLSGVYRNWGVYKWVSS